MSVSLRTQMLIEFDKLGEEQQLEVLNFMRSLTPKRPKGVTLDQIMHHVGSIPPDDLARMAQAIEDACERIDPETWDVEWP